MPFEHASTRMYFCVHLRHQLQLFYFIGRWSQLYILKHQLHINLKCKN